MANDQVAIWNQTIKLGRSPANGELLIGNGADFNLAALTAGSNVTITNSAGGITIASTNPGGTVTGVTASSPLASSGGTAPDISLSGTVAVGNGGTGATTLTANNVILGNGTSAVQFVAPGTSGNILTSNGTTWTSAAPSSGWMAAYASADKSVATSTILSDWTGLSFSVAANKNYCFRFVFSCDNYASGGSRVAFTAPASPSSIWYGGIVGAGSGTNPVNSGFVTTAGAASAAGPILGWTNAIGIIEGTLFNGSNAGTLQVQVAQSSASGTTTFRKGSFLQYALLN
jgi:hypothetical protein